LLGGFEGLHEEHELKKLRQAKEKARLAMPPYFENSYCSPIKQEHDTSCCSLSLVVLELDIRCSEMTTPSFVSFVQHGLNIPRRLPKIRIHNDTLEDSLSSDMLLFFQNFK